MTSPRKFIIDTDAGVDDSQAILMALSQEDIDVIAITTCHGNVGVDQVTINVIRVLEVAKKKQIPIFKGCETSILGVEGDSSFYHGKDGLGGYFQDPPEDVSSIKKVHAVIHLVETARKYPGEITLVCLGPLTNIAMAQRLDPNFSKNLRDCYIMGGNYEGKGNITCSAEFNFHSDPEAADVMLRQMHCPVTLACWELCLKYSLPWSVYWHMRSPSTEVSNFLKNIEGHIRKNSPYNFYIPCDEVGMAIAINPKIVERSERHLARVELSGTHTRGQVVLTGTPFEKISQDDPAGFTNFVFELNKSVYEEMLRNVAKHDF